MVSKVLITSGTQQTALDDQELKEVINAIIYASNQSEQSKNFEQVKRYKALLAKLEPLSKYSRLLYFSSILCNIGH
ncbi:MAG TPA: hypothetical protein VE226_03895 [Nitrososphaeraceae archaeon]|nr:hypothetical protein [Nitrososphaeraceae archaeon]